MLRLNDNMTKKSIEYSLIFLDKEIKSLKKAAFESKSVSLKKAIERRIYELEKDKQYFMEKNL